MRKMILTVLFILVFFHGFVFADLIKRNATVADIYVWDASPESITAHVVSSATIETVTASLMAIQIVKTAPTEQYSGLLDSFQIKLYCTLCGAGVIAGSTQDYLTPAYVARDKNGFIVDTLREYGTYFIDNRATAFRYFSFDIVWDVNPFIIPPEYRIILYTKP